jgi:histidinol-phosphate/aromatic aminotransferase/cobyric acid decarboxylase-like protein/choline kinase
MQAVILAAGYARRMRPFSDDCHKAMLEIGGTTILARIVEELTAAGVNDIHVATGYRADEVEAYLTRELPGPDYFFHRNERYRETNNIVSLALALDGVDADQDVLLVECDLLLSRGLLTRLARHRQGTLAVVDRYRTGMDGTVVTVENGLVTQVFPPYLQADDFEFRDTYKTLNIYRFSAEFCRETLRPLLAEHLAEVDETSYYEVVLARLGDLTEHAIAAEVVDGVDAEPWAEVDDPVDLAAARFLFEPSSRAEILAHTGGGRWGLDLTDFDQARNANFPTESMLAATRHALAALVSSRGSSQAVLDEKLAWFLESPHAHITALSGASQALPALARLWADRDVAIATPAYDELARRFPNARTFPDAPGIDTAELERLAATGGVIALANPNTLTGTTLDTAWLHGLAAAHPATTFLVDETHVEFSGRASLRSRLDAEPLANVVVIGSLGASVGVPGLRLGYLHSTDPAVRAALRDELPLRHLNSPAEHLLEILLKSRPQLAASLERCRADRDWFRLALLRVPFVAEVHPSGGNFLLARLHGGPSAGAALREHLLTDHAIDVPDVSGAFADRRPRLRIAVRAAEQNAALVSTLTRIGAIPTDHLLERAA